MNLLTIQEYWHRIRVLKSKEKFYEEHRSRSSSPSDFSVKETPKPNETSQDSHDKKQDKEKINIIMRKLNEI